MKNKKKSFQEWMGDFCTRIGDVVGLGALTLGFVQEKKNRGSENMPGGTVLFSIKYSRPYKKAEIYYYPVSMQLYEDDKETELEDALVHEICHIITSPLFEVAHSRCVSKRQIIDADEEVTEHLALIVRRLVPLITKTEIPEKAKAVGDSKPIKKQLNSKTVNKK